jgi:hypothetical protein
MTRAACAVDIRSFLLRRFFRVAPACFAAAVLHFCLTPRLVALIFARPAASFLFIDA